jgi:hypothetical protein
MDAKARPEHISSCGRPRVGTSVMALHAGQSVRTMRPRIAESPAHLRLAATCTSSAETLGDVVLVRIVAALQEDTDKAIMKRR